ncbi:MAG TPA: ABC transporter permease, partial [Thermoanaerobaculia bacterium]|nr:ABC transporter permease [Thermoanaerobaculia bacterium]
MNDLRHAFRGLGKSPGFAAVAILTLALGIAANTTVFSWIQALVLRPLAGVPDQERVMVLGGQARSGDFRAFSVPDVRDLQAADLPVSVAAFDMQTMNLAGRERPERVWAGLVTGNLFEVLDVQPVLGRGFRPEEDRTAATHPVVVLGHRFWQSRFAGDPKVVGQEIQLNNRAFTVVGVAPEGFAGPFAGLAMDLYVPLAMQPVVVSGQSFLEERGSRWLDVLVRLKEGATVEEAQAAINTVAARLGRDFPDVNGGVRFLLYTFAKSPTGATSYMAPVLTVLGGMVGIVLLIACANVANLLLVRALGRRREVAIRLSLGAGRWRLIRQLLAESLVLVVLAGTLGLLASRWGTGLLAALIPPTDAPVAPTFALDGQVLAFACVLSLLTGVLFSLAPALQLASPQMATTLREEGTAASAGGRKARLRSALVVAQIALSAVLLIAAGLFVRSLEKAAKLDPGFSARNVLLASVDLFPNGYNEERGTIFFRRLL